MTRNPFGWAYPAGAEHDPNAPWNEQPEVEECPICGKLNRDAEDHLYPYCSERCAARSEPDDPREWDPEPWDGER